MKEIFIGLIAFASGLLMPWVKWEIDKRRRKHDYQKELIASYKAKTAVAEFNSTEGSENFRNSHEYSSLRLHMKKESNREI